MPAERINRIMIAGTNSGCGKTTVTCAVLKALINQGNKVASFKCGPDYIDPMFHSRIIGAHARNIDLFLCGEQPARYLFAENSREAKLSVVEGVMGFYDGMGGRTSENSSYDISERFDIPVVLVVSCKGAALSVVAMIKGYLDFHPNKIKAVILNHVSKAMYPVYREIIEEYLKIRVLGFLPQIPEAVFESRHLGLVTAAELNTLQEKIELLAKSAAENIDLKGLLALSEETEPFSYEKIEVSPIADVNIAVAKDRAFCFYYEDSLNLLRQLGANLIPFSPIEDKNLPQGIDGCILGGGYPELYLNQLGSNLSMRQSILHSYENGLPIYAECGGYMYLGEEIMEEPMVGVIPMRSVLTDKLQNFGYVTLQTRKDNYLFDRKEPVRAHEFHYSVCDNTEHALTVVKSSTRSWVGGYSDKNLFALYPHIHLWGNIDMAKRFIKKCEEKASSH